MGLQLSKEQPSGISINYWRISEINFDYRSDVVYVTLLGYKDYTARSNEKTHIKKKTKTFTTSQFNITDGDVRDEAYPLIKALDDWNGASNVYESGQP